MAAGQGVYIMRTGIRKREKFRHWNTLLECVIMGLGLGTILLGVFIFFNADEMLCWLPLMFLLAALVNTISSMKAFYYGRRLSGAGLFLTGFFIFAFAAVSYITLWT